MSHNNSSIVAEYVGWKAIERSDNVDVTQSLKSIVGELLDKRRLKRLRLKKQQLEFGRSRLRIFENVIDSEGNEVRYKYPSIPATDIVALSQQVSDDSRILCAVLLGFNEESHNSVHAHVWRGNTAQEVASFVHRVQHALPALSKKPRMPQQQQQHPHQQQQHPHQQQQHPHQQQQHPHQQQQHPHQQQQHPHHQQQQQQHHPVADCTAATSLAAELRQRLGNKDGAPLLDPPRDYDTMHRSHGNVMLRWIEKPLCSSSKAPSGAYIRRSELEEQQEQQQEDDDAIDEPERDYNSDSDQNSLSSSSFTGSCVTSLSQRLMPDASLNLSERSFSDHSADPARGFSTWRRRRDPSHLSVSDARRRPGLAGSGLQKNW